MKTNNLFKTLLLLTLLLGGMNVTWAANKVTLPTTTGTYIDWNDADLTACSIENDGANIGSTGSSTVATFTIENEIQQDYVLTFQTAADGLTGKIDVTLTNSESETVLTKVADIVNTGSWYLNETATPHQYLIESLPTGTYTLTFATKRTTGSYAGNWGKLAIYASSDYDTTPGTLSLSKGLYSYNRMNEGSNVGFVENGRTATYQFINTVGGVYQMTMDICRYNIGGTMNIKIIDGETRATEADYNFTIASDAPDSYTPTDILIPYYLTTGVKIMTLSFSNGSSYICNYKAPTFSKQYDHIATVSSVAIAAQTITAGDDSDWYCALPVSYDATTTFGVTAAYGTVEVTAVDDSEESVTVTDNGDGTYTIPTPSMKTTTTVIVSLTANSGSLAEKSAYKFKIFRIGEISLTGVTVDGVAIDVLTDINDSGTSYTATYSGCYTTTPAVAAVQIDDAAASVSAPVISGSTYTYTIHGAIDGTDLERDYTLVLNNVHVYAATGSETTVNIKANEGTIASNTWSNGVYSLATTSLDSYNEYFKMNGDSYTLSVPADVVVKQLIMKDCSNNYSGNDARLTAVTSTGATAYIPVENKYYHDSEGSKHDIIVNIDDHAAGTDIVLTQQKKGQPMAWIQLTTVKSNPGTAPVKTAESVTVVNNHAVVAVTFDREISNNVTATINGGSVTAEGGASTLYFPVWDLSYSTNYTLTIPAEAVEDNYGNKNASAIEIAVNVPAKTAVTQAAYDYVVSTAGEFTSALAAVNESNKSANATRKVIFVRNGDYDFEGVGQSLKAYNVSIIGESKSGVILHGNRADIKNPILDVNNTGGNYFQDFTVRNDKDFDKSEREGVGVALSGGKKAIFKNISMESQQDTQVSGERAYYINCDIYGAVDFICGGGDHFYDQCNLIITNSAFITAPSTNPSTKWGYVFSGCTIDKYVGSYTYEADGNYSLGRAWQNEPRSTFLNTKMNVQPQSTGWANWGELPTHFYEYGSVDSNGDAINLSGRKAPTNSSNLPYTPVLTAEQAAKFTLRNVLGGTDSWLPTDECPTLSAPASVSISGTTLSWSAVDDARCYVIFKDGDYYSNQTATSLTLTDTGVYTVKAANLNGGLGTVSSGVTYAAVTLNEAEDYTPAAVAHAKVTLTRTIIKDNWSTLCLPFNISADDLADALGTDVTLASFNDFADGILTFVSADAVTANVPCMIKTTDNVSGEHVIEGVTIANADAYVDHNGVRFQGVYASGKIPSGDYFFNTNKLYRSTGNSNIKPFRAYFTGVPDGARIAFFDDDETTGISDATRLNDNGKLKNDNFFDLQGRRVAQPAKGLYIVNGKKMVVK